MPELYNQYTPENSYRQSPTYSHNDRHTPMKHQNFHDRKPEVYHVRQNDHNEPMHNEQSYRSSSPPLDTFHHPSHGAPEMYHLKGAEDHSDIDDHRPSPAFINDGRVSPRPHQRASPIPHQRASPMPLHTSSRHGPEMYYLKAADEHDRPAVDEYGRQSPHINDHHQKPKLRDNSTHHDDPNQQKITVNVLTTADGESRENLTPSPPRAQRTPSPPIRPSKKQQPFSYDIVDNDNKHDVSKKQRPFPTGLHDVSSNVPYVPLSQSKASESIQRSMNKYRFGAS